MLKNGDLQSMWAVARQTDLTFNMVRQGPPQPGLQARQQRCSRQGSGGPSSALWAALRQRRPHPAL